jgi:hypothetical protein
MAFAEYVTKAFSTPTISFLALLGVLQCISPAHASIPPRRSSYYDDFVSLRGSTDIAEHQFHRRPSYNGHPDSQYVALSDNKSNPSSLQTQVRKMSAINRLLQPFVRRDTSSTLATDTCQTVARSALERVSDDLTDDARRPVTRHVSLRLRRRTVTEEERSDVKEIVLPAITDPIIDTATWERLTGREFQEHPELMQDLAVMGEQVARVDTSNTWIAWTCHDKQEMDLAAGDIQTWTGKSKRDGYGSNLPWIKTRSVVPMTPVEMVDLLMDSSRVTTYNPWSIGREDLWVSEDNNSKIVRNRTQPPLGSKVMVATTLLHAQQLDDGAWMLVSRAVGGDVYHDSSDKNASKSDILLGVNLLEPYSDHSSVLTAVTHVYSSAVPLMLAERLGVKSAVKFVKDIRAAKIPAI